MFAICTAINYQNQDHYFGRNLDLEHHYDEKVVITPRNYPFMLRQLPSIENHYAMIGMATVVEGYPLYYEGTNEHGVSVAGLNFPGNAHYFNIDPHMKNIASFELIPYLLSSCKNMDDIKNRVAEFLIVDIPFNNQFPPSPLHWLIGYRDATMVLEQTENGLYLYENPIGILTNNPTFPYHLQHLSEFQHLSPGDPINLFSPNIMLQNYSHGMGAIGLPGDLSSASRFVRGAFMKENATAPQTESASVSQFFHILSSVSMSRGSVIVNGAYEITNYSCCCNTNKGIYYYTTYDNSRITAINMFSADLDSRQLCVFPLRCDADILYEN